MLPSAAAVLEDDDMLAEILLRLPPQPSSLPRASAVCKCWRSLASDPAFSRRFRRHHRRNPPLLGCFVIRGNEVRLETTLDHPNRLPEDRFRFPFDADDGNFMLLGCRHGFLLMVRASQGQGTLELLVWDPFNGREHPVAIPPGFGVKTLIHGAVLRAALGEDMDHFQVVLVSTDAVEQRAIASIYSSEMGVWGNVISTPLPPNVTNISRVEIDPRKPAVLVGDSLYMLLLGKSSSIIEFNFDRPSLAVVPLPVGLDIDFLACSGMQAEGGGTGLLFVSTSDCSAQLWKRKTDCYGLASWVLGRTIEIGSLLSLGSQNHWDIQIRGFAEENNVVFLWTLNGIFMVQLDSLQFKKLPEMNCTHWYPFECVYAAGI